MADLDAARRHAVLLGDLLGEALGLVLLGGRGIFAGEGVDDRRQIAVIVDVGAGRRERDEILVAVDLALAGLGEDDELVAEIAADRPGLGDHRHRFQPHAGEGAQIGDEHLVVGLARVLDGQVEGIGILHQELPPAHHAESRPDLVAELPLDVIEDARQILVGLHRVAEDGGDQLLVGRTVQHLALVTVLDAKHLLAVGLVAAALLPQICRLNGRHRAARALQRGPAPRARSARSCAAL